MYPNSSHLDEPTMTDLRGILPGQRPPIDATVLDEPTSEVPIIRPAGAPEPEPEVDAPEIEPEAEAAVAEPETEAVVAEPAIDTEPETLEAPITELDAPAAEAVTTDDTALDEEALDEEALDEEALDEAEVEAEVEAEEEPDAELAVELMAEEEPPAEPVWPLATPPVVPAFGSDAPPAAGSEMAKMSWAPAAPAPPGLVPASPSALFEPSLPPPVTEPDLEPVEPATDLFLAPEDAPEESPAAEEASLEPVVETIDAETEAAQAAELGIDEPVAIEEPEPVAETAEPEPAPAPVAVAAEPAASTAPEPTEPEPGRAPGEVAETSITLWSDEATEGFRERWRDLQVEFVDDPADAINGAKTLVTEVVHELADTLLAAQATLDPFSSGDRVDTEAMRVAMRSYREFLERVLAR